MSKHVATEPLFVGRIRAANPGDEIPESALRSHPEWRDKVTTAGGKAAEATDSGKADEGKKKS